MPFRPAAPWTPVAVPVAVVAARALPIVHRWTGNRGPRCLSGALFHLRGELFKLLHNLPRLSTAIRHFALVAVLPSQATAAAPQSAPNCRGDFVAASPPYARFRLPKLALRGSDGFSFPSPHRTPPRGSGHRSWRASLGDAPQVASDRSHRVRIEILYYRLTMMAMHRAASGWSSNNLCQRADCPHLARHQGRADCSQLPARTVRKQRSNGPRLKHSLSQNGHG